MDLFEFTGKLLFEDIPNSCEKGLDSISNIIDGFLD